MKEGDAKKQRKNDGSSGERWIRAKMFFFFIIIILLGLVFDVMMFLVLGGW